MDPSDDGSQPNSRTSSRPAAASVLRPRVPRLISGLDEDLTGDIFAGPVRRTASPRGNFTQQDSRPASPIPQRHPSRTNPADRGAFSSSVTGATRARQNSSGGAFSGIFGGSWSALQGLASNVLGSSPGREGRRLKPSPRAELEAAKPHSEPPVKWGSTSYKNTAHVGAGSLVEREQLVREAKRKDMLAANGHSLMDGLGKHKRRKSDDVNESVHSIEQDEDALVYIHHVKPSDTIAGICIRFSCAQNTIRKANRLWISDPVQARKTLVLPVDACAVKGKPVAGPSSTIIEEEDLLGDETITMHESPDLNTPNGWHTPVNSTETPAAMYDLRHALLPQPILPQSFAPPPAPPSTTSQRSSSNTNPVIDPSETPWKHESWVLLPHDPNPIEIGRLPRRNLGFFPRARRKSLTYSDSARSTPKASLDLQRDVTVSPGLSPAVRPQRHRPASSTRARSSSTQARPSSFAALLSGPGGVGTLDRTVRLPGPGPDSLNTLLGPHLPDVRPPNASLSRTGASGGAFIPRMPGMYLDDEEDLISLSSAAGAVYPPGGGSGSGGGVDFGEIGGAIEALLRKAVSRAANALDGGGNAAGGSGGGSIAKQTGTADLIEMVEGVELGDVSAEGGDVHRLIGAETRGRGGSGSGLGLAFGEEGMRGRRMGKGKGGKGD